MKKRGFTVVEGLVALAVFAVVGLIVLKIQRSGSDIYLISAWKQDRLQQLQLVLKILKEDLSEASNIITKTGTGIPTITECPLQYRKQETGEHIFQFSVHHFKDDGTNEYEIVCSLKHHGSELEYSRTVKSGTPPAWRVSPAKKTVTDMKSVTLQVSPVFFSKKTGYEFQSDAPVNPAEVEESGALLSLSFELCPPANVKLQNPLTENVKMNIHVKAVPGL